MLFAAVHSSTPVKCRSPILGGTARRVLSYKQPATTKSQHPDCFKEKRLSTLPDINLDDSDGSDELLTSYDR